MILCFLHAGNDAESLTVAVARVGPARARLGIQTESTGNNKEGVTMLGGAIKNVALSGMFGRVAKNGL